MGMPSENQQEENQMDQTETIHEELGVVKIQTLIYPIP